MAQERFDKNYQKAILVISTGRATAQQLIDTMESSYSLTAEQKAAILDLQDKAA